MKIALLADVHGNAPALTAVLAAARAGGAVRLLIAGDLVGYYYDIVRVLELLAEWDWVSVQGNHEEILDRVRRGNDAAEVRARYGSAIERAVHDLNAAQLDLLTGMPPTRTLTIAGRRVLICHGSPWDRDTYVYPDADRAQVDRFFATDARMVLFGHTHYPVHWRRDDAHAVNPGSVGQPRDRRPGACWAMWDTGSNNVDFRREPYDPAPVLAACATYDPQLPYLSQVLTRQ